MLVFFKYIAGHVTVDSAWHSGGGCGGGVGQGTGLGQPRVLSWDQLGAACTAASVLAPLQLGIGAPIGFGSRVARGREMGQRWVNRHTTGTAMTLSSSFCMC
jgi:hypothetical protein